MPKCKQCKVKFTPKYFNQKYCMDEIECIKAFNESVKELRSKQIQKAKVKEKKAKIEQLMTKSEWLKLAQKVFNKFIRIRDKDKPCVSCGVYNSNVWHASHFYPTTKGSLRFNEDNVWKSCQKCNVFLHGNLIEYRKRLIDLIGIERVNYLDEHKNDILNISIDEIKEKIKHYNSLVNKK